MPIMHALNRIVADIRARHRRRMARAHLASLPLAVQKDIGWSDAIDRPRARPKHGK